MKNNKLNLSKIAQDYKKAYANYNKRIIICAGTGCVANGSLKIHDKIAEIIKDKGVNVDLVLRHEKKSDEDILLSGSGCQGFCQQGPLVEIQPDNILYTKVKLEDVEDIIEKTIINDETIERLVYENPTNKEKCNSRQDIPFYKLQTRSVMEKCGSIDAMDIREYIAKEGYKAAETAYLDFTALEICEIVKESGLRGRGGGGFATGKKWDLTRIQKEPKKYIICNGDEGDPGAFMDRSILEGTPHSVIEGMLIAARAIGADEGYIYVRMEYPLAVERMRKAVKDAEEIGILGNDVFGSGKNFKITVMEGAGAFVCGEASAMVASIMGNRGMPKPKPPRTAEKGLWDKPTVVNNVETLASVPDIILRGPNTYRENGTAKSPGTKTFALTGHVPNTGLIEVPFGTTLREIVFDIGGGVVNSNGEIDNDDFKLVQIGGPSGGCLTKEHLDIPLDFDSLSAIGAMVGSGGLVVMNKSTCIVQVARFFMKFTQHESCGKCVPCREGTKQMLELLDDIIEGRADETTIPLLETTAKTVQLGSLCGLGKSAPNPILSTLEHFRDEYEKHVNLKYCPTKECKALTTYEIIPELCKGCTLCSRVCPVGAIEGKVKEVHKINPEKCIKCGACVSTCKFKAISGGV